MTKNAAGKIEGEEPGKVDITAIHDVEGAGFGDQEIEDMDIGAFAVGDVDEAGNGAARWR